MFCFLYSCCKGSERPFGFLDNESMINQYDNLYNKHTSQDPHFTNYLYKVFKQFALKMHSRAFIYLLYFKIIPTVFKITVLMGYRFTISTLRQRI